ncbi:MAG: aldehyde ferredoxin oxidoreductase C-terminal domain-containing protein, partial [Pseudomonadota bacterium]
ALNLGQGPLDAETLTKIVTDKMEPYAGDPFMLDFNTDNQYSEHVAKLVAWQRHYTRFWKQSILYCDVKWPDFVNTRQPDNKGLTGEGEPKFFNAVTGKNITFMDGMETGKKIWNLDNAIWTLQGRHRDMVKLAEFIHSVPYVGYGPNAFYYLPWYEDGKWSYKNVVGRTLDRDKVEDFKTVFYQLEGWDTATGWPRRSTLESMDLGYVADELEKKGRLGAA